MKILDWYYRKIGNGKLDKIAKDYSLKITWIIEAGCHDATDTLELIENFKDARVYAFEPDPVSRAKAEEKLASVQDLNAELHPFGLSNERTKKYLNYSFNERGSGTTSISDDGVDIVELITLDGFMDFPSNRGLLWLDVEGHAVEALDGMRGTLRGIDLAKIEVQMHQISNQRPQDYAKVIKIMNEAGLIPSHVPLQPGFFGDIYFIRRGQVGWLIKVKSQILISQMRILHECVYPMLKKPKHLSLRRSSKN